MGGLRWIRRAATRRKADPSFRAVSPCIKVWAHLTDPRESNLFCNQFPKWHFLVCRIDICNALRWVRIRVVVDIFRRFELVEDILNLSVRASRMIAQAADHTIDNVNITEEQGFKLVYLQVWNQALRTVNSSRGSASRRTICEAPASPCVGVCTAQGRTAEPSGRGVPRVDPRNERGSRLLR